MLTFQYPVHGGQLMIPVFESQNQLHVHCMCAEAIAALSLPGGLGVARSWPNRQNSLAEFTDQGEPHSLNLHQARRKIGVEQRHMLSFKTSKKGLPMTVMTAKVTSMMTTP